MEYNRLSCHVVINDYIFRPDVEEFRYPRAESPNPISTLKLVNFTLGPSKEVSSGLLRDKSMDDKLMYVHTQLR